MSLSPQDLVSGRIPAGPLACDGERELRCPRCRARCTRSPTSDLEYGHKARCPRRPDHFPYAEGPSYDPEEDPLLENEPEIVTDGGEDLKVDEDDLPPLGDLGEPFDEGDQIVRITTLSGPSGVPEDDPVADGGQVLEDGPPALLAALRVVADRPHLEPYQSVTVQPFEACFIPEPDGPAVELMCFDGSTVETVGVVEPDQAETDADLHQAIKFTAEKIGLGGGR